MSTVRVFVVDDHPVFRHGLASMIRAEREFAWVGDAAGGAEAVCVAPALRPDLLLVDLVMPRMDGVATLQALRPLLPRAFFVVLVDEPEPGALRRALDAGASACLPKSASSQELVTVMHTAASGHRLPAPSLGDGATAHDTAMGNDLTPRERELLGLMARGLPNDKISARLTIAMPTVKFHVTNILAKLNANNRTDAVLKALKHKLVRLE